MSLILNLILPCSDLAHFSNLHNVKCSTLVSSRRFWTLSYRVDPNSSTCPKFETLDTDAVQSYQQSTENFVTSRQSIETKVERKSQVTAKRCLPRTTRSPDFVPISKTHRMNSLPMISPPTTVPGGTPGLPLCYTLSLLCPHRRKRP